ncbi:16S rRNA (uracil(1498)-N(3))-methyltransferase [Oceanospirillum linum]|uniref:Ribosomal RNA small subunit methyltransferase E n=1 Tax=Oceanospirillum linum TaxID=966 RepID=A0A1T1HFI1_OCELI|nr:16S rRNA (uracil(1498)-N(3))-methyltransferase [Oceanospirillum linum]OOV88619.1 16S rRNA (uracil(1498)-N(3))-methyltransferase [Oceanospirillum linum]SEG05299.1 RNA methyltransferase, RsmE family [Oleiphilus messinensis]SMP20847.1 RNA methyltransferase, RsmE family [Oceanospirillum linum]
MNLILLYESDFISEDKVRLNDYRAQHIQKVHRANIGDQLKIGRMNQLMGSGVVLQSDDKGVVLRTTFDQQPPAPLPLTLILALPRPRMLARSLQHISTLGVKRLILLHSQRVEKSYWMSPEVSPEKIRDNLILGLEQAKDTVLPEVLLETQFKPFVEDRLPEMVTGTRGLVAHPGSPDACPRGLTEETTLAIGPEGGFIPYEVEKLTEAGLQPVHLGERILRVETAVTALLSRLF